MAVGHFSEQNFNAFNLILYNIVLAVKVPPSKAVPVALYLHEPMLFSF